MKPNLSFSVYGCNVASRPYVGGGEVLSNNSTYNATQQRKRLKRKFVSYTSNPYSPDVLNHIIC